jgi:hypothetical protein
VDGGFIELALELAHQRESVAAKWIASQLSTMRRSATKRVLPDVAVHDDESASSSLSDAPTRGSSPMPPPPPSIRREVAVVATLGSRKRQRTAAAAAALNSNSDLDRSFSFAVSSTSDSVRLTSLPAAVLWRILALWHDVYAVSRSALMLVCRAFRLNLRLWSPFVVVNLRALDASVVAAVQQYADVVAANDAARDRRVPSTPPPTLTSVHPLATLLRDARRIEFVDDCGACEYVDDLIRATGALKGVSRCQRDLLVDITLPGARRRPLRPVNHLQCTGADVGPLCGLSLVRCALGDAALGELGERCAASLETLECRGCPRLTGAAIRRWCDLQRRPQLYLLVLERCPALNAAHFQRIAMLRTLEHLSLRECARVGEPTMMAQVAALPALRSLGLSLATGTTDRSLQVLFEAQPPSLRTLDVLGNANVTFDGLYDCVRIVGLECVNARFVAPLDAEDVRVLQEVASGNNVELLVVGEDVPRAAVQSPAPVAAVVVVDSDHNNDDDDEEFYKSNDDEILHSF